MANILVKAKIYDFKDVNTFFKMDKGSPDNRSPQQYFDDLVDAHEKSFAHLHGLPNLDNSAENSKQQLCSLGSPKYLRRLQQKHRLFKEERAAAQNNNFGDGSGVNDGKGEAGFKLVSQSPEKKFEVPSTFTSINIRAYNRKQGATNVKSGKRGNQLLKQMRQNAKATNESMDASQMLNNSQTFKAPMVQL